MFYIILFCAALVYLIYRVKNYHAYWKKKSVPHLDPVFIFGDIAKNVFQVQSFPEILDKRYKSFPDERYFGIYQFLQPTLVLKDPELIRQITVKDFDYFPEHRTFVPEDSDPLWGKNLFASKEKRWREMRPTLSPSFTSSKMKFMYSLMSECAEQFSNYFLTKDGEVCEVELKDVFTRYTNDVIATTAFGIKVDSLKEQNNEFYLMGKDATDFGGLKGLKFFLFGISPLLMKFLGITIFSKKVSTFFRSVIKQTVQMRTENHVVRQDMIQLLMEARKGKLKYEENAALETGFATVEESHLGKVEKLQKTEITDDDITAQALIFFLAGFDTAATLMCLIAYELGVNPDVQEKLRAEVDEAFEKCNGKLTYEILMGMKYMDMVVSETLRKWPPAGIADRVNVRPYTIEPTKPGEKPIVLEKNSIIWLPMFSLHRDPKFYENPDKFDPERFSDENKHKIIPYSYIPFGSGPRNCIGSRFAILENKTIFFHILRNFEIVPIKKSPIPLKLDPKYFNYTPIGGFWMGFKKRQH